MSNEATRSSKRSLFELDTPCFVYDEEELRSNILSFKKAVEDAWADGSALIGFSVKTAPIIPLIAYARGLGCLVEVVSDDEFDLAIRAGCAPKDVIFNGPIKSREWLHYALANNSIVNLDSQREIRYVIEYLHHSRLKPKVGLRINFDIESLCPGETSAGKEGSRFGFCCEDGSLAEAIDALRAEGIELVGLHAHFSTKNHSPKIYREIASAFLKTIRLYDLSELEYLDFGGGYFGGGANREMYNGYAQAALSSLSNIFSNKNLSIIFEPGGSILCTPGEYVGRVIDAKTVCGRRFVVTELSKLNLNSTVFSRRNYRYKSYRQNRNDVLVDKQVVCGYTCIEMDRICDIENEPKLNEGDIVSILNAGAYTTSFMPKLFIQHPPKIYMRTIQNEYVELSSSSHPSPPHIEQFALKGHG